MEFLKNITIRKYWWLKLLANKKQTYLYESGWMQSYASKKPINLSGEPMPWLSLPFVHFLEPKLKDSMQMFEYGAGYSTLYFKERVGVVHSVEHDKNWLDQIALHLQSSNVNVQFKSLDEGYVKSITQSGKKYDLVIVDGRMREQCAIFAADFLTEQGVLVLDDSEREKYSAIPLLLEKKGFKKIDFWGMALGGVHKKNTSLFYKANNILEI